MLSDRYNRMGNMLDFEAAISRLELAVSTITKDDSNRVSILSNFVYVLSHRYNRTGNIHDLAEAISRAELVVSIIPGDHPDRAEWLSNIGSFLSDRYSRTGSMDDLEAAISREELAVSTTPENHLDRAVRLNNLGMSLAYRYDRTGNMHDLEAAISRLELAVSTIPENHPNRARILSNLGDKLSIWYRRTGNVDYLEAAIFKAELAISTSPEDHPDQAALLNDLGIRLALRYNRKGNIDDLEAASSRAQLAVSKTPEDHPNWPKFLTNLGNRLSDRYDRTGNIDDLEAAISTAELAISTYTEDRPDRALTLISIGVMKLKLYSQTRNLDDLQTALKSFTGCFDLSGAIPLNRMIAARQAIRILVSMEKWNQASSLAQAAIALLPLVCGRYLSRGDQQYAILQISGLAADACSLSLKVGHVQRALQQLEFGRGVILGYLIDGRNDLADLQNDYPHLANEYDALRYKAYTDIEAEEPVIREQMVKERRDASSRLEDCLRRIRQESGYERFLLEATVEELKAGAKEGPIVIVNATDIRCDAIIVSTADVQAIALPELNSPAAPPYFRQKLARYRTLDYEKKLKKDEERDIEPDEAEIDNDNAEPDGQAGFDEMAWLWSSCVKPVLERLKRNNSQSKLTDSHDELLRVWWIGTGIASSFPFHAAGLYDDKDFGNYYQGSSDENTLSQIIPSYTPTIKALSYARSCASGTAKMSMSMSSMSSSEKTSILVVTMPTTPEHKSLPGVEREKLAIQRITKDVCRIKTFESPPTASQVLNEMSGFDIVHFACHGLADPEDPSNSHLALQKSGPSGLPVVDELTVSDISKRNNTNTLVGRPRPRTWLAYLSACSTAGVEAKLLADEALHLVSAFQLAGFAHVIGSLWPADDDICVRLAEAFYRHLTKSGCLHSNNRAVAEALRNAILEIREQHTQDPLLWATFIHSGA